MNWPFVRRSRYENAITYASNTAREIVDLKERNELLTLDNTKLRVFANEESVKLLFDKKDLKQKIRKLESENSKLKTTNKQLQAIHKTLGFFIRKAYEQLNK